MNALQRLQSILSLQHCLVAIPLVFLACSEQTSEPAPAQLDRIRLPKGFVIDYFAENVPGARSLALGADGTVFVGSRGPGVVYALPDRDRNMVADTVRTIASGLRSPNGVAIRNGDLYVAEISRVLRYPDIATQLETPPSPEVIRDDLPTEGLHGWKFLAFGPDDKLYVPIGAPCNSCESVDPRFASITRMNPDGTEFEVFASGIRNTVGFAWHPDTDEMWFTDNGRDQLGDDIPPDELNRAPKIGLHFGYPYCHGGTILDPQFGSGRACADYVAPEQTLGPHVAALGLRFYTGRAFPSEYHQQILIAEHGSWNRSVPIGYRISLVRLDGNETLGYEVFADGWLQGDAAWGRPVDLLVMPDGSILVSDDRQGAIYRIRYDES